MTLVDFLRDSWTGALLILAGVAVMVAEAWLLTAGTPLPLVVALFAPTGLILGLVVREVWEDWA